MSPVCGSPVLEDAASLGNGAFGSGLDLTIYYHVCVRWVRARVDYIVMCLPCDVLIRLG